MANGEQTTEPAQPEPAQEQSAEDKPKPEESEQPAPTEETTEQAKEPGILTPHISSGYQDSLIMDSQ